MKTCYRIEDNKAVECGEQEAEIFVYNQPSLDDEVELKQRYNIDGHTLLSALDPDELSRLEFEDDHVAIIFKKPRSYCADDNFLLRVSSCGIFLYADKLVIVMGDDSPLFEGRVFFRVRSLRDVILRVMYQAILHFEGHLKAISMLSDSLEKRISTSLENRYLINMFALEKSLVYILNSIGTNAGLFDKMKAAAHKIGFDEEQIEILDDITIENKQCFKRAEIHAQVLGSLMDARASIVNNNLNHLIKKFTIITISIMLATFVVSLFSMNVPMPVPQEEHLWPFWFVVALALGAGVAMLVMWRLRKW